jgi:hypothetical protein
MLERNPPSNKHTISSGSRQFFPEAQPQYEEDADPQSVIENSDYPF